MPAATALAGDTVIIYADGVSVASGLVAATGDFMLTTSALVDGLRTMTYTLTDPAGNVSAFAPVLNLTVDTMIVTPTVDTPIAVDDTVNSVEQFALLLAGTAEAQSAVTIRVSDGINPASTATAPSDAIGHWTLSGSEIDISGLEPGSLSVEVTSTDLAGNAATSVPVVLEFDPELPQQPVVETLVTNNVTPVVTGGAVLAVDETLFVTVNAITYVLGDGNLVHDGIDSWTLALPLSAALAEAIYSVDATVTDDIGNSITDATSSELEIDLTPPSVPVVAALAVSTPLPVIPVTANTGLGEVLSVAVNGVTYTEGDPQLIDDEGGSWLLAIDAANPLADGVYSVVATITDAAGNSTNDVTNDELTVNSGQPFIFLLPIAEDNFVNTIETTTPLTIAGTTVNVEDEQPVVVRLGDDFIYNTSLTGNTWSVQVPIGDLVQFDGLITVEASTSDAFGTAAVPALSDLTFDTLAPTVTLVSLVPANTINSGAYEISGTCTVGDGDVNIVVAGAVPEVASVACAVDGTWLAIVDVSGLPDADNAIDVSASQTDEADNTSPVAAAQSAKDTVQPSVTIVHDGSVGDEFVNAAEEPEVVVIGTTTGVEEGQIVTLTFTDGTLVVTSTAIVDANGEWLADAVDLADLDEGNVTVTAEVMDSAANSADPADDVFTIDRTGPDLVPVLPPATYDSTPTLTGTVDLPDGAVIDITTPDGEPVCTALVVDGQWACDSLLELPQGDTDLVVRATDPAGNVSVQILPVTIDNTIDTDLDGIPDIIEGTDDNDGDGIPNNEDPDSDNDGIDDSIELAIDTDLDGVPDYLDPDSDDDGISDALEGSGDADFDGQPDFRDLDSDADGIPDSTEGNSDADSDGIPDYLDPDLIVDTDGDGIPDLIEGTGDSDGDGTPDNVDTDSDGDGIADSVETAGDTDGDGTPDYLDQDSDGDGIDDIFESTVDTDKDGITDFQDTDSDNDGIDDSIEGSADSDNDGVSDRIDLDSDNDGLSDRVEGADDHDGDGIIDARDIDSDNDGLTDLVESRGVDVDSDGRLDNFRDADSDGVDDLTGLSAISANDTDSDGIPDHIDLDSDNDTIPDALEAQGEDDNRDGEIDNFVDNNGDGLDDGVLVAPTALRDTDSDGVPDHLDVDADNDGIPDVTEVLGADRNANGLVDAFTDTNGNGLHDGAESGPLLPDSDADGTPDYLELDSDGDGLMDLAEAGGTDANQDGRVDSMADDDLDGIPNSVDVDITRGRDADNDGIDDAADVDFVFLADFDGDGIVDAFDPDANGDGFADDAADSLQLGQAIPDEDNDGTPDFQEGPGEGRVQTGIYGNGIGCSVVDPRQVSGIDPMLPLMALLAIVGLLYRRRGYLRVALLTTLATLGGCSLMGDRSEPAVVSGGSDFINNSPHSEPFNKRVYIGGSFGVSTLSPTTDRTQYSVDKGQGTATEFRLGMDFTQRLSAEVHFNNLGEVTFDPEGSISYQEIGGSALLYAAANEENLRYREGLLGFIRLGAGVLNNSATDIEFEQVNAAHLLVGFGFDYGLENGLGIRGELVAFDGDVQSVGIGLVYRFGDHDKGPVYGKVEPVAKKPVVKPKPKPKPVPAPAPKPVEKPKPVQKPVAPVAPIRKPVADSDGDGVLDNRDSCDRTPKGAKIDEFGCQLFAGVLEGVQFAPGSSALKPESRQVLDRLVKQLKTHSAIRVELGAHTDNQGSASSNLALSRQRVITVARYLIARGIDKSRLVAKAYGQTRPIADNQSAAGRAKNRRVEVNSIP